MVICSPTRAFHEQRVSSEKKNVVNNCETLRVYSAREWFFFFNEREMCIRGILSRVEDILPKIFLSRITPVISNDFWLQ